MKVHEVRYSTGRNWELDMGEWRYKSTRCTGYICPARGRIRNLGRPVIPITLETPS